MVTVNLKGVTKVTAKGRVYYYAWRGGPRLSGEPGSAEYVQSYLDAHESLKPSKDTNRFNSLIIAYKSSADFERLAVSTKRNWTPWLDRIADAFGELRIAQFDRPEKIRPIIRRWRAQWANKPRTADYGLQVLSRVLAYGVDPLGKIAGNPCEGIKQLYSADRSEIIWHDADWRTEGHLFARDRSGCRSGRSTGLRLGDLLRLSWSQSGRTPSPLRRARAARRHGDHPAI